MGRYLPYNRSLVERARELRKNMTPTETKLWNEYLRYLPTRVLRQRPISNFIVDFYIAASKLVIEVDGESHFTSDGEARDKERTQVLEGHGLRIIRFSNVEVYKRFDAVCQRIDEALKHRILKGEN